MLAIWTMHVFRCICGLKDRKSGAMDSAFESLHRTALAETGRTKR
jgi:hypothetical protein